MVANCENGFPHWGRVSVIIPAYNVEKTISASLESIFRQQVQPDEIIVVDDGSTDDTARIVKCYMPRVCYVYQNNRGPSEARNRGIGMATGELIAFLDADDLWPEDTLAILLRRMAEDETIEIVQGRSADMWPGRDGVGMILDEPVYTFQVGSALYRRSVFTRAGLFDPHMRRGEDIDFWVRVHERGGVKVLVDATTLYYRRRHTVTRDEVEAHKRSLLRIVRQSVNRQREKGGA